MAAFCNQCDPEYAAFKDFYDPTSKGFLRAVLCEGCGPTHVDYLGNCVDPNCLLKHGAKAMTNDKPNHEPTKEDFERANESMQCGSGSYAIDRQAAAAAKTETIPQQAMATDFTDDKEDITKRKLPILCLDFDGVLHAYKHWTGPESIPEGAVPGAILFLREALDHFEVHVFSSRSAHPRGIAAMRNWIEAQFHKTYPGLSNEAIWLRLSQIKFPFSKPPAFVTIDDRSIPFNGSFPTIEHLKAFKPWWQQ